MDVLVPPDFTDETSGDLLVPEGGNVKLTCRAKGHPTPHVQWRREDGMEIVIREPSGQKTKGKLSQIIEIYYTKHGKFYGILRFLSLTPLQHIVYNPSGYCCWQSTKLGLSAFLDCSKWFSSSSGIIMLAF